jgi:hypothetical protein
MSGIESGFWPFVSVAQARMRATRRLFDYWVAETGQRGQFHRTDLDPAAIADILPFIILGDIEVTPFRVRFRLVGTSVVEFSRLDFSGKYLDDLIYGARDSVDWSDCYRHVHAARAPIIGNNQISFLDGKVSTYEFAILPLWRGDDPAGSFIASEAYEGLDRLHIPDLEPVEPRS